MKKILVIEDDSKLLTGMSKILRWAGYQVFEAGDGVPGLQLARAQLPHLVICDQQMTQLQGTEVLRGLRSDPRTASIPFILMTGLPDRDALRPTNAYGADDYLVKPFKELDLLELVKRRLERFHEMHELAKSKLVQHRGTLGTSLPPDVMTPLASVVGYADLMAEEYATLSPSEILEMSASIRQSGQRLLRAIQNIVFVADLDRAASDLNLLEALRRGRSPVTEELVTTSAKERGDAWSRLQDLEFDLTEQTAMMRESFLQKIVEELVDNALKFSKPGTKVQIATTADARNFFLIVRDSGRGILPEQVAQIDAFKHADRKRFEQQGMGMGLIIVKSLIELHQGTLSIESDRDTGTSMLARLPVLHHKTAPLENPVAA